MIEVTIQLFGPFTSYSKEGKMILSLPKNSRVSDVRGAFIQNLKQSHPDFDKEGLVGYSVFANEQTILDEETVLSSSASLAVIPPVSGG